MRRVMVVFLFAFSLAAMSQDLRAQNVFVSTQGGGQILNVDTSNPGHFTVFSGDPGLHSYGFAPEGMTIGPDGKLYITDQTIGQIYRMNQDGTQPEIIYFIQGFPETQALPQGPSFSSSSTGDLYFNSSISESGHGAGVLVITGVGTAPYPFTPKEPAHVAPSSGTCIALPAFCPRFAAGGGAAFDNADNLLFVEPFGGTNPNSVLSVSPPYTPTDTPATVVSGLNLPIGVALNKATGQMFVTDTNLTTGLGEILRINPPESFSPTSVYYTFPGNTGTACNGFNDQPTFMQFDGTGNLFVVTSTLPFGFGTAACGKVWRIVPPCDCSTRATLILDLGALYNSLGVDSGLNSGQAIGIAFSSSGVQAQPQSTTVTATQASGGTKTFGWPPTCTPGDVGDIGNCIHTYGLQWNAGMFGTDDKVTVTATEISQADWAARNPAGTPYFGTKIAPIAGYGGNGVVYTASCTHPMGACATPLATNFYITGSSWRSTNKAWCSTGPGGNNPIMWKSEDSTPNTFEDVLVFCGDGGPKHIGGSGPTLSNWGNGSGATGTAPTITIASPADGATYAQNEVVPAVYNCGPTGPLPLIAANCFGGEDLVGLTGMTPVSNGGVIDTSTRGPHTFEVTADVNSGPGDLRPGTPAALSGFTTVLVPPTVNYMVVAGGQASASPAAVNFGTIHVGRVGFQFVRVTNTGAAALTISNVRVVSVTGSDSDDFLALSGCPRNLGAGKSCFILVVFLADADVVSPQFQSAILTIADSGVGGALRIPLYVTVLKP